MLNSYMLSVDNHQNNYQNNQINIGNKTKASFAESRFIDCDIGSTLCNSLLSSRPQYFDPYKQYADKEDVRIIGVTNLGNDRLLIEYVFADKIDNLTPLPFGSNNCLPETD